MSKARQPSVWCILALRRDLRDDPSRRGINKIGKGAAESSNLREIDDPDHARVGAEMAAIVQKVASNGYVRNKLTVLHGGKQKGAATARSGVVDAEMPLFATGSLAVASETIETVEFATLTLDPRVEKIREARMKGYEGDSCGECGNFTLVRNGTCLKCETCGSTSGCS